MAGKRTLAVRLGEPRTRGLYVLLLGAAAVAAVAVAAATTWGRAGDLGFLVAAVPAVRASPGGRAARR